MVNLFGKKKDDFGDIPDLPPLDLDQIPSGPPLTGAPQRLEAAENARLTPAAPTSMPPAFQMPPAPAPPIQPAPPMYPSPALYGEPQAPSPQPSTEHVTLMTEDVEKIAEDIIDEKWTKLVGELNEIKNWKDTVTSQISEIKETLSRLDTKISDVQKAMIGKVGEYNKNIKDANVELKAMSKVFEKIMPTFTDNVKRLSNIKKAPITKVIISKPVSKPRGRPKKK